MKAIVLTSFGGAENFQTADWPKPDPRAGEVRIRILAAAFNPADYKLRKGLLPDLPLPTILGFDLAGLVDALGPGVKDLSVGDQVFGYLGGPKSNGSYAEYTCVPAQFVALKPAGLSFPQAAAVPLTGLTAYQCVLDKARVQAGEAVFIAGGSGGLGTMAIQLARYAGAYPILTTGGTDQEIEYLTRDLGIPQEHVLRYPGLSLIQMKERVLAMNQGKLLPATFDFVGGDMKRLCCHLIDFDGRVVSTVPESGSFTFNLWERGNPVSSRSASVHFEFLGGRASFGGPETWGVYRKELDILRGLLEAGHIKAPRITPVGGFSAETVGRAHTLLEEHRVQGKLVMSME
jgi:NADPH2:quinone reductase